MIEFFKDAKFDWMGKRRILIAVSIFVLLAGLFSAALRDLTPGGTSAFNLGVDFKGGTVVTAKFKQRPAEDEIRSALQSAGISDTVIQASTDKTDEVLIKVPILENAPENQASANANTEQTEQNQVNTGRATVKKALDNFGKEAGADKQLNEDETAAYKIVGTDSVGPVAGEQLRNQAIIATSLGLLGILLYIAFRYDWTYAAGAVIAVLHDVLMVLAFFSVFQWEVSLTVIAAILTIIGFSVNDSIVIFDRIRENLVANRTDSLYKITNDSVNQTLSRTIITSVLVLMSVLALVIFGGDVLRGFSLALLVGVITGVYSTVAIASPIAIWWQQKLGAATIKQPPQTKGADRIASASRRPVTRRPVAR
jgi:preprotein translocase subunit SecF